MSQDPGDYSASRRDFLRMLGAAVGGAALAGGGVVGTALGQGGIPSGYTFYKFLEPESTSGGEASIGGITPGIIMGNFNADGQNPLSGTLFFHGSSNEGVPAIFRVLADYSSKKPRFNGLHEIVTRGKALGYIEGVPAEQLPLIVSKIGTGSGNSSGNYATTLVAEDTGLNPDGSISLKSLPGVYLFDARTKFWRKVARFGDESPDDAEYGGIFGDVVLNEDNSVTFVAATTAAAASTTLNGSASARTSSFIGSHVLVQSSESGGSTLLLKTGDMLPGTNAMIQSFGLIDVVKGEYFIAQVSARRVDLLNAQPGTAVVQGRISRRGTSRTAELTLHAAEPHLCPDWMLQNDSVLLGRSIVGARVGANGMAALVTHIPIYEETTGELDRQLLTTIGGRGSRNLIATAGNGEGARRVGGLCAPVVSSEAAITYFAELLEDGSTQLVVTDGSTRRVILQSGDLIEGSTVTDINHGYHPAQVDVAGRIAFTVEYLRNKNGNPNDPANIQTALVIGIPA